MTNIYPDWPAPSNVYALSTTRNPGMSTGPFYSNNLAFHVQDNPLAVSQNRLSLMQHLQLPNTPEWLEQTHSTHVVVVEEDAQRKADASISRQTNKVLTIMTADCLPILLCNQQGTEIAAIHAGWRGLVSGIIENTIIKMNSSPEQVLAWIGPAICQTCFEVGPEVRENYIQKYPFTAIYFKAHGEKWHADLPQLARSILNFLNIYGVFMSNLCTFEQKNDFYSYRREQQTGRIASLIWFT